MKMKSWFVANVVLFVIGIGVSALFFWGARTILEPWTLLPPVPSGAARISSFEWYSLGGDIEVITNSKDIYSYSKHADSRPDSWQYQGKSQNSSQNVTCDYYFLQQIDRIEDIKKEVESESPIDCAVFRNNYNEDIWIAIITKDGRVKVRLFDDLYIILEAELALFVLAWNIGGLVILDLVIFVIFAISWMRRKTEVTRDYEGLP